MIPFFITRALQDQTLPLYGDGGNCRDWLFVEDTVRGLLTLVEKGEPGQAYNLGAGQERSNNDVTRQILRSLGKPESLIRPVADRKGHDFRYALDWGKIRDLGWQPPDRLRRRTAPYRGLVPRPWRLVEETDREKHFSKPPAKKL